MKNVFLVIIVFILFVSCEFLPYGEKTEIKVSSSAPELEVQVVERSSVSYIVAVNISNEIILETYYNINSDQYLYTEPLFPNESVVLSMEKRFNSMPVVIIINSVSLY